ncbi:MAG: acetyl-CoA carboxylase biotin carboxylase subunit [Vicinamibacterales bacterium]
MASVTQARMASVIRRVLVANRGEIAVRIIRACREVGIETVAVYSDADALARHTRLADFAVRLGPAPATESYLDTGAILDAARRLHVDAVHPGYGFLSENAAFADACRSAGLIFVGPSPEAISAMGSKTAARARMEAAGVPVVPGARPADQTTDGVRAAALSVGFPLLIKASAGGGGKGMRGVESPTGLDEAIDAARREAEHAFGDGALYVERRLDRPRHVEIQVFGDGEGHVVHLFERDCSVQRRHQKIIEESPSPILSADLRRRMGDAAVAAARAVGYRNAGTVEFLVQGDDRAAAFYFLEMNTRLQVEHAVTEAVVGVDLVHAQLAVAAGQPLPWDQASLSQRGHAIECRVYAEDPACGFLPQAGRLLRFREPSGPGVRVDAGAVEGDDVTVHYDPMLAKVIAVADTRDTAIARACSALSQFAILGLRTNVAFLRQVLNEPAFRDGRVDVEWVERDLSPVSAPASVVRAAAAAALLESSPTAAGRVAAPAAEPWQTLVGWRG